MKKRLSLRIALYKDGTVMLNDCADHNQTYESGVVRFIGTIAEQYNNFDPLKTMEKSGLVTTAKRGKSVLPEYKATNNLRKMFARDSLVLCYTDTISTQKRLNGLIDKIGVTKRQALDNLKDVGIIDLADVYQLNEKDLEIFISN